MRLIVTHEQPDFDALASLALAKLLFPGAVATTQGSLSKQIRAFLRLYRDELDLVPLDRIDLEAVKELIVVDTADPARIKPFDQLLGRVPVTLYDHHPTPRNPIVAARGITGTSVPGIQNSLIVTESGLVFGAGRDNFIRAWDSDTGKQLWSSRFGGNFTGAPVMYVMEGTQYLLVAAASTVAPSPGAAPAAGAVRSWPACR